MCTLFASATISGGRGERLAGRQFDRRSCPRDLHGDKGVLMAAVSPVLITGLLIAVVAYLLVVDQLKVLIFWRFKVH